jgi:ribonuclease BN (tRNA processing enzyme)
VEVVILGTGTATPSLTRNASGIAVRCQGHTVLVDMGPGTLRRLCEARLDPKDIDAILITHFHPDHVSDLVPFLFASNYAYGPTRTAPFFVVGVKGLGQFYEALVGVYHGWIVPTGGRMLMRELNHKTPDFVDLPGVVVRSVPSNHSAGGLAYRIEADSVSVTISGDTDVSEDIVALAQGTDLFICECSMPEGRKISGHLVPSEAAAMARQAGARKMVLTHFYPPCDEVDVISQARPEFSGEIVRAEDLMVIRV